MASIAADLGKSILEKLMNNAIAESRYICCFSCIVEEFEEEKKVLEAARLTVDEYARVEKGKANNIRPDVTSWQVRVKEIIQVDTKMKKTCFFGWCPNCKWRYSKGKQLANTKKEIERLLQSEFINGNVGISGKLPGVEYHSSQDYISFEGRESKIKELLEALIDDNNFIIGLQGMGGTGKTTLAKEVGKELAKEVGNKFEQYQHFDHVIDTTVSYSPDIRKIQDDIAASLGLDLKDKNESERLKLLWNRLTGGEKILLILDDVWNPNFKFDEIGIPNKDNHKGCRILLTTRVMRVCYSMGCERIIQLELLSEEDAWTLFKKHANISDSSSKRLLDKGRDITKECKGLPVAIAAIASSLKSEQRLEEWKSTLKSLQKSMPIHGVDENLVEVYKCLRYSYDNLKNEEAKRLFLLCSMFQEDQELSNETLTRFGIGAGLFGEVDGKYDEVRNQVVVAKNKLVDSCLLLKGGSENVKMHDLVREVALWIANEEIQAVNVSNKNQKLLLQKRKNIKYLLLCEDNSMDVFSCEFDSSKLEILDVCLYKQGYGYRTMEVPNSFFENMTKLRVLHLSVKTLNLVSLSLPQSFHSLTSIRSLILERFFFLQRHFSFLKNLPNLETLDLVFCTIVELSREIANLEKLRVLYLRGGGVKNLNSFEVIGRCSSLEELYIINMYRTFDISAVHEKITFPAFQRYIISDSHTRVDESFSRCVAIPNIDVIFSEVTFKHLVQTSELLRLQGIKGEWRNLIPDIIPIDKGMNDLVQLFLSGSPHLRCLIDTMHVNSYRQSFFSKLIKLGIDELENLEELCNGPFPSDFLNNLQWLDISGCINLRSILFKSKLNLCNLKTMYLNNCPKLVSLFQLSTCQNLLLLEELSIHDCDQLKNIIADERVKEQLKIEIVDGENDNKSCGSMFPNLKIINIRQCPQLEYILPTLSTQDVPLLETIRTHGCGELKYIFHQYQHEHASQDLHQEAKDIILGSLKEVEFSGLPNFIDIFPKCCCSICSSVTGSSCKNDSMEKIESNANKYNISPWIHMCYPRKYKREVKSTKSTKIPLVSNESLQDSTISLVPNIDYLHLWQRAHCLWKQPQILRNIKEIELKNFSKIKSIFILSIAPMMLETLRIQDCYELKHIIIDIRDDLGDDNLSYVFPKLKKISVKGCGQLEYIFGCCFDDHQNHNKINLDLLVLESLCLHDLPSLIGIFSKNYSTTLPPLMEFEFNGCSQISIKSIGDFILALNNRSIKELSGNVKHLLSLKNLRIHGSKIENIFCFNEIIGQQIILGWQNIWLEDQPHMTYLLIGPKNSFILQNLRELIIVQCEKLEVVLTTSISRCLPQLLILIIKECKKLKQIIEKDVENQEMSNYLSPKCFPKLEVIVVKKCNKLTYLFPVSIVEELPLLRVLIIKEASELKEVFKCESDQKVEIPQLFLLVFVKLPIFSQGIELGNTILWVQSCPKLSLTSTIESDQLEEKVRQHAYGENLSEYSMEILEHVARDLKDSITQYTRNENQITEITEDIEVELDIQATSQSELASSEVNTNQSIAEINHQIVEEVSSLKIPLATTSPIKRHEPHSDEDGDGQITTLSVITREHPTTKNVQEITETHAPENYLIGHEAQATSEHELTPPQVNANQYIQATQTEYIQQGNDIKSNKFTAVETKAIPTQKAEKDFVEEVTGLEIPLPTISPADAANAKISPLDSLLLKTHSDEDGDGQMATPFSVVTRENPTTKDVSIRDSLDITQTHAPAGFSEAEGPAMIEGISCTIAEQVIAISTVEEITAVCVEGSTKPATTQPIVEETGLVPVEENVAVTSESTFLGMEEINKLIEEDPLSALENLLTGKVSISQMQSSSIGILLQDLKALLMDSNLDHLVTHEESRSKLISLLEQLNQHQRLLSSEAKDFVRNVDDFFNDYFGKHTTSKQVIKKHKQLLQSKDDLLNKLSSAKSTQAHVNYTSCTAKVQIDELSLKIDDLRKQVADMEHQSDALKLTMKMCDLEKEKLKAECTQWAQQSTQLLSALASSEIDVQEVQHANNMAKVAFANLKSSFPSF